MSRRGFPWLPPPSVLIVGGGMITRDVILPTVFQLRRQGIIGDISLCTRRSETVESLRSHYPNEAFHAYPDPAKKDPGSDDNGWQKMLDEADPGTAVLIATPDHMHTEVAMRAIERGLDMVVQKPLALKVDDVLAISEAAREKGIYVLTDFHKRHDPAIRGARHRFRKGHLGQMLHGHAWIEERREMPLKTFARWAGQSSPFEYIGVHYVDAYYFITGLKPRRVVAFGQKKFLAGQGMDAFDSVQAAIEWEDGSAFWIQTAWVLPDGASSLTNQGMHLLGTSGEYWADHKDRNCRFVTQANGYEDYNPNFFKAFDSWEGNELVDYQGYGYRSIAQGIVDIREIRAETAGLGPKKAIERRREIMANLSPNRPLPDQAVISVAVAEAARLSIEQGNRFVEFRSNWQPRLADNL